MALYTSIKVAKNNGAGGSGTSHFIRQRITALFMIPLAIWFVVMVISLLSTPIQGLPWLISSPFAIFGAVLFIINMLYHAHLGLQMIIEDYVQCKALRYTALILLFGFNVLTLVAGIISILTIYILSRIV